MSLENHSYVTIAEADEYWVDRNDTEWAAATTQQKTAALIRATEYIDGTFDWIGTITDTDQILSWPRTNAVDKQGRVLAKDAVPQPIKHAVSWLAKNALTQELNPAAQRGGDIKSVKAGPVEVEWGDGAPSKTTYDHLYKILKNLIVGGPNQIKLVRT